MSPAWQGVSLPLRHLGIQLLQKETDPRNENIILTYSVLLKWTLSRTRTAIERNRLYKEKKTGNLFYLYFLAIQCGLQDLNFLTPGTELGSWQWKDHVLPTGPPVNSGGFFFFYVCFSQVLKFSSTKNRFWFILVMFFSTPDLTQIPLCSHTKPCQDLGSLKIRRREPQSVCFP